MRPFDPTESMAVEPVRPVAEVLLLVLTGGCHGNPEDRTEESSRETGSFTACVVSGKRPPEEEFHWGDVFRVEKPGTTLGAHTHLAEKGCDFIRRPLTPPAAETRAGGRARHILTSVLPSSSGALEPCSREASTHPSPTPPTLPA